MINKINTKQNERSKKMTIFKLIVNDIQDIIHYDITNIENRKNEILKHWIDGNKYGFSSWTGREKPTFKIIKSQNESRHTSGVRKDWTMVSHCQDSANFIKDNGDGTITLESFHRYGPSSYKTMTQAEYKTWTESTEVNIDY